MHGEVFYSFIVELVLILPSDNDAHCGYSVFPHTCWRYCGDNGKWCYIQPTTYCEKDGDCDSKAPCVSPCGLGQE